MKPTREQLRKIIEEETNKSDLDFSKKEDIKRLMLPFLEDQIEIHLGNKKLDDISEKTQLDLLFNGFLDSVGKRK